MLDLSSWEKKQQGSKEKDPPLRYQALYVNSPPLMIMGDQTNLHGILCPTSDLTCGETMLIITSKEVKIPVKTTTTTKTILF